MPHYRCYFIAGESIKAAESVEAVDDAGALLKAEELILKCEFLAVEVWKDRTSSVVFLSHPISRSSSVAKVAPSHENAHPCRRVKSGERMAPRAMRPDRCRRHLAKLIAAPVHNPCYHRPAVETWHQRNTRLTAFSGATAHIHRTGQMCSSHPNCSKTPALKGFVQVAEQVGHAGDVVRRHARERGVGVVEPGPNSTDEIT